MRDEQQTNEQQLKIELLSQWTLEAEFRKCSLFIFQMQKCSYLAKSWALDFDLYSCSIVKITFLPLGFSA